MNFVVDASEKERNVKESVDVAKKAVSLDIKDGTSWSESVADYDYGLCFPSSSLLFLVLYSHCSLFFFSLAILITSDPWKCILVSVLYCQSGFSTPEAVLLSICPGCEYA